MNLGLSDTQEMIRDSMRQQLQREVSWERVSAVIAEGGYDDAFWKRLAADGWLGFAFPESMGGGGADLLDVAVALEEISKSAAVVPFAETMACVYALTRRGTEDAQAALAEAVVENAGAVAPALAGPGDEITLSAEGAVSGSIRYVDYGPACTYHLVSASGPAGPQLLLVDAGNSGVTQRSLDNVGRTPQSAAAYTAVPAIAAGGEDAAALLTQAATVLCCVQLVAFAQQALDLTIPYVRDRVQFGRAIGTFQAVQQQAADMVSALDAARYLTYEAVWKVEHGTCSPADLATVKAAASRTGVFVTLTAHQLHGGMGMTEEYPLHFFSRRAKERSLAWGSEHESLALLADSVTDETDWR